MPQSGPARVAVLLIAGIVIVNVLFAVAGQVVGPDPSGPPSSSYATTPDGLAAYEELLRLDGRPVVRLRSSLAESDVPPGATLVLADPGVVEEEQARALRPFVDAGGRLVVTGATSENWVRVGFGDAPTWAQAGVSPQSALAPAPENAGIGNVAANGAGSWDEPGGALPILGGGGESTVVVTSRGLGRIVMIADTSVLSNDFLGQADNAAFGLQVAGPRPRPVVFVESVHGYGESTGLSALPDNWLTAVLVLGLAAVLWLLARGHRFGPPERELSELPPPRRAFVDSMAVSLMRTGRRDEALAGIRSNVRDSLERRYGLAKDTDIDSLRRAALDAGLDEIEVRAIVEGIHDDAEVLAAGRAQAKVRRTRV